MRKKTMVVVFVATALGIATKMQAQGPTVPRRAVECRPGPVVANCGAPPVQDGRYRLKSAAKLSDGRDLCLNVATQNGKYQQFDCSNVDSSHFYFAHQNADQCYRMEQERSGGRETHAGVGGIGIDQVDLTCPPSAREIQWQLLPVPDKPGYYWIKNQQTGKCIDADNSDLKVGGKITPQSCKPISNQFWTLFH
jgi:hypothetical protein